VRVLPTGMVCGLSILLEADLQMMGHVKQLVSRISDMCRDSSASYG